MANRSRGTRHGTRRARRRRWPLWLALAAAVLAGLAWHFRAPIAGYSGIAAAYSARVACSCRFVAGRSLDDCEKDKLAGMELVTLTEDVENRSVTARFPFLAAETTTLRDGYGCVMEPWEG
ncbi:hypothetical protein [Pelagerythrobacter marinus]|uniref:hypothetical protein n=1 Tax=Pelagerythrobacter marinus TaxID=538382 RepID=UPI002037209D|nr:hypothetical protein [Pelagerythrobacter marinus]USA39124.1 hypothetical protein NCF86_12590 [Pelagerythrobacter marinus]WPZ06789.1 hypothetical protein T8T98_15515 [Pelagerythrobacter marinus]